MEERIFAILEIYGKQTYAGIISEHKIGDNSFIRVDVPAVGKNQPFTKLFGQKAIFSITFTDENTVNQWLKGNTPEPVNI